jgi:maleate isomerase
VGERHAGLSDNLSYGALPPAEIQAMALAAAGDASVDAILFFCTNLNGAPVVVELEARTGLPVIDSTAAGVWALLKASGFDAASVTGKGRLFAL